MKRGVPGIKKMLKVFFTFSIRVSFTNYVVTLLSENIFTTEKDGLEKQNVAKNAIQEILVRSPDSGYCNCF